MKCFFGLLSSKFMVYLFVFILYIVIVGDIVDGVDIIYDFNFFIFIYECFNDVCLFEYFLLYL